MSSTSIQKLFCGIYSVLIHSFDEFGGGGESGLPNLFLRHLRTTSKAPLDESERVSDKAGLKQHSKSKIMASSPITSWQIDGETMETVTDFICLGSKITVDSDCSHEI